MLQRDMDPAFWNAICNNPNVRPWLGGEGPIDVAPVVLNPANYCLRGTHGGFICINHGNGAYSVHSQFLAEGREATTAAMRAGCDFMFTRTDCMTLWTQLPDNNKPAANLAAMTGFEDWFRREVDPLFGPSTMARLPIDSWIMGPNGAHLAQAGENFHDLLECAKLAAKSDRVIHDDDPAHDRYVGAASLMCERGQPAKGVTVYNNWAAASGYAPISLISAVPPVVDVVDAVVGLDTDGKMEVLLCR
jgi:hypothetical protein